MALAAVQSVTLPMVQDFGWSREIEDRLLAPIPIPLIAAEKIVMGVLQGVIAAVVVLPVARAIMGPIPGLTLAHAGALVLVTVLGAGTFSALGLLIGSVIRPEQIGLMFSIIIAPMIFFGCAYYPWRGLDVVRERYEYAVLINHASLRSGRGMRGALTPALPHMSLAVVTRSTTGDPDGVLYARPAELHAPRSGVRDVTTVSGPASDTQASDERVADPAGAPAAEAGDARRSRRGGGGGGSRARERAAETVRAPWTTDDARAVYNIDGWGAGFFDINEQGHVVVRPDADHPERQVDLFDVARDLEEQGVALPVLLRFSDILRARLNAISTRFTEAIQEFGYTGGYTTVYPIKVNQQRHVVEEIVRSGRAHGVGLECGSKPELQAVLALSDSTDHMIVCNGYKDEEFMRLALMGQRLGHKVFIVIEQLSEIDVLLQAADDLGIVPMAGVRIKLRSAGYGRWAQSGGERSKFGLTAAQLVEAIEHLKRRGRLDILKLIHFHLGSQITDIRYIKSGLQEIGRFYAELRGMGVDITHVDVGGGLGVDYDGTSSTSEASVNYTLQEYANDVIYVLGESCREGDLPMPHVISESGRALTAHQRAAAAQSHRRGVAGGRRDAGARGGRSSAPARHGGRLPRVELAGRPGAARRGSVP